MIAEPQHQPITAIEADTAFSCLERFDTVVLAVSGGPDSLALLYLVAGWAARRGQATPKIFAATVDHQLRPQSATEAALVANHCTRLGVPHSILNWDGPKPWSGLMEEARRARYQLLGDHMRPAATMGRPAAIVTAHTLDDQAETLVMRLKRGSGVEGLACIPAERSLFEGTNLRLVRPLLDFEKTRLIATLQVGGVLWCEDPTNEDAHYERVRVRRLMQTLQTSGVTAAALARTARRMRDANEGLTYASQHFRSTLNLDLNDGVYAKLERRAFEAAPAILRQRLVRDLIALFGGTTPTPEMLEIEHAVAQISVAPETSLTLGGAVISTGPRYVRVWREFGRINCAPVMLQPGRPVVWDGRFRVSAHCDADTADAGTEVPVIVVKALGSGSYGTIAAAVDARKLPPAAAAYGLPAFWAGETLLAVPALGVLTDAGKRMQDLRLTCDPIGRSPLEN